MPHVSKKSLPEKTWREIYASLSKTLLTLPHNHFGKSFIQNLLTPTEQTMLAKRLAIIALSLRGLSSYAIEETLKVSSSTVLKTQALLDRGRFASIRLYFKSKQREERFLNVLEHALRLGMPRRTGRDRWKFLDRY